MPARNIVILDTRRLNRILKNIHINRRRAISKVAFAIERLAKMKAPVDTGALRASIYTRIGSRQGNFIPGPNSVPLPEPENEDTAHVGPSVEYGIYQELGTSIMSAQPYITPAVREVERQLAEIFSDVATGA